MPYKDKKYQLKHCREYKELNKERISKQNKLYYLANKKRLLKGMKEYRKTHRLEKNQYEVRQRQNNIHIRLLHNLRGRILKALKENIKTLRTVELIGCSVEFLKFYLETMFTKGMTWENYGKWHVDHIEPCVNFDLSKPDEQCICFHYTNLQPLWAEENLSKGRRKIT